MPIYFGSPKEDFCARAERYWHCEPCWQNCCDIKGRMQPVYADLGHYDTISVCREDVGLVVATDIEVGVTVPRVTGFPILDYKGMKPYEEKLRQVLRPEIEALRRRGLHIEDPDFHEHLRAEFRGFGGIHVHVEAIAKNFREAQVIVREFQRIVDPKKLESAIR